MGRQGGVVDGLGQIDHVMSKPESGSVMNLHDEGLLTKVEARDAQKSGAPKAGKRHAAALPAIAPITHNVPLHELAYQALRRALMSGRFQPGQKLSMRGVAEMLQVSPMPVRASLARLHAERALLLHANGTAVVPTLDRERLKELMELRILLEGQATARAATRMTEAELAEADIRAKNLLAALQETDVQRYMQANAEFKLFLYGCARAPVTLALIESLWLQHGPYMNRYGKGNHYQAQRGITDVIINALKARKPAEARAAIRRDIRDGLDYLMATLEFEHRSKPAWSAPGAELASP
jgi:DNA-binding GntR family transcriptional regulator